MTLPWSPRPPSPREPPARCAVVDVGTNTVLLTVMVADAREPRRLTIVEDLHFVTGLGKDRNPDGGLTAAGQGRTLRALKHVATRLEALGIRPAEVLAATTAAVREAPNGRDFVRAAGRATGIELETLAGEAEAELVAIAQERSFPGLDPWLVVDVGGGSTEIALRRPRRTEWAVSLPVGSVKLAERWGDDVGTLEAAANRALEGARLGPIPEGATVVGVAGTVTTALQLAGDRAIWDPAALHGEGLELADLRKVQTRMVELGKEGRRAIPGLHPGRADAIVAGVTWLLVLLERVGCSRVVVSDRGVRFGLLWRRWPLAVVR